MEGRQNGRAVLEDDLPVGIPHCLLLEIFTRNVIGTAIVKDEDLEDMDKDM